MYTTPVSTETPNSTMKPMPEDTENGVPVTHSATMRAERRGQQHAQHGDEAGT